MYSYSSDLIFIKVNGKVITLKHFQTHESSTGHGVINSTFFVEFSEPSGDVSRDNKREYT